MRPVPTLRHIMDFATPEEHMIAWRRQFRVRLWVVSLALFIVQALIYTGALRFVEVSTAFPIGSIGFVVVALLSQKFLAEPVTGTRWTGVVLITLGVGLLALQA